MRLLVLGSAIALVGALTADACAQGGGGCNRRGGYTGGATAVAGATTGSPALLSESLSSPSPTAIAQAQMRLANQMLLRQAYLAQLQMYAQRQAVDAARKAAKKEAQIASRKARREAEIARRSGSASRTSLASNDTPFPALAR